MVDPVSGRAVVVPERILRTIDGDHGAYFTPRRDVILDALAHAEGLAPDPRAGRHRHWRWIPQRERRVSVVVDDDEFDVLRLRSGNPAKVEPDDGDASLEDCSVVWSEGRIVAIEILDPRWLVEQGREIVVTPEGGTVLRSPDVERAITPRTAP